MSTEEQQDEQGRQERSERPGGAAEFAPLVEEVRRFAAALGGKAVEVGGRLRESNPEVYGHLAAAGGELLAAYRAAVAGHERRWSAPQHAEAERVDLDGVAEASDK
ncbi:hypothetical protein Kpho02_52520 [Kitasatospora phosalacinea]|uniref:DUF5304 domain-containing protein n=1 Tax=Kitasatospora phosalacinea TaxID=2065 RepID=A0A9W6QDL8_9ACTN|nr:DUF5304 family protein [Kitasatospora phosalacinea]GLW72953.1 hypothetical protein Kpho02_52520 [Kitasatospora phosalacinea]